MQPASIQLCRACLHWFFWVLVVRLDQHSRIVHRVPQAFVSLNWVLSEEPLDLETELGLDFLDYLLVRAGLIRSSTTPEQGSERSLQRPPEDSKDSHRASDQILGHFECARPPRKHVAAKRSSGLVVQQLANDCESSVCNSTACTATNCESGFSEQQKRTHNASNDFACVFARWAPRRHPFGMR